MKLSAITATKPLTPADYWNWIYLHTGIKLARAKVCPHHSYPLEILYSWQQRPTLALCLGPRGGGKSFMSAIDTDLDSRFIPNHQTRILGGSEEQAKQIHQGISEAIVRGRGPSIQVDGHTMSLTASHAIKFPGIERTIYHNGNEVQVLAASPTSVRGPHIPTLKLDEVDEIDPELREAAMGMCMGKFGVPPKCIMTSTWHRVGGPMADMVGRAQDDGWPYHVFCMMDVLERCPAERSGPYVGGEAKYEKCPECPLKPYCHTGDIPLAKLADGHYSIDGAIQKIRSVSSRTFKADYLCLGATAHGIWFTEFTRERNVTTDAEYDPDLPVYVAIDTGPHTAVTFFQIGYIGTEIRIHFFGEHLYEFATPEQIVKGYKNGLGEQVPGVYEIAERLCNGKITEVYTDPAGNQTSATGVLVINEYANAGMKMKEWPRTSVLDSLSFLEAMISTADGRTHLFVHPRCRGIINAFEGYRRDKRNPGKPADPQHPFEDWIDSVRCGIVAVVGLEGRRPKPVMNFISPNRVI